MKINWLLLTILSSLFIVLTGCGIPVEEQISSGIINAETVIKEQKAKTNKTIEAVKLYLPDGYSIEKTEVENNYIIQKGKDQYILFINENENKQSQVHYNVLKNDQTKKIIEEKTFELENAFGFVAIIEVDKETYELIASSGAAKMSTISKDNKMDEKLRDMMTIAHSVKGKE